MDTTKPVVGQKIWMQSGDQSREATVIEITEEYIAVKPVSFNQDERPWIIHFQTNGKQFTFDPKLRRQTNCAESLGNLGVYELYPGWGGWMRFDPHPMSGESGFPWELKWETEKVTGPGFAFPTECGNLDYGRYSSASSWRGPFCDGQAIVRAAFRR